MKIKRLLAALFFMFFLLSMAVGQHQGLQVNVVPKPPFSPRPGDYFDNPTRFCQVIVTNPTATAYEVYLTVKLEMVFPDAISAEVPNNRPPAHPLTIAPFQTLVLNYSHFEQLLGHLKFNHLITNGIDPANYSSGAPNLLPEGTYRFCVVLYDFKSGWTQPTPVSADLRPSCATFNICYAASAPVLTTPTPCMMSLPEDNFGPQNPVMISWLPPAFNCGGTPASFNYHIKIVEVMPGQDLQTAIDFNPIALQFQNVMATTLPIDTMAFPGVFRRGERYAIQVSASEVFDTGNIVLENEGRGPICTFMWGTPLSEKEDEAPQPQQPQPDPEPVLPFEPPLVTNDPGPSTDPQCMSEVPANQQPYQGQLNSGQQVKIGQFTMTISQASQSNGLWSGTGLMAWNPHGMPLRIRVQFQNIRINTSLEVYEGAVYSQAETALNEYVPEMIQKQVDWANTQVSYADQLASMLNINNVSAYNQKMQGYYNYMAEGARDILQLTGDINLPVNIGSALSGTNIHIGIVGMVFTPQTAKMNTFTAYRVSEAAPAVDRPQWLAFVGHGMCFTPNITVSPDEASLFLAANFTMSINGNDFTFLRSSNLGDKSDGTFVSWNNDGFDQGRLSFDLQLPNALRGENEQGQPNNNRVSARFSAWFSDWNDWIASGEITSPFQVKGVTGFGFVVQEIVYDHSLTRNPQGIVFPVHPSTKEPYNENGNNWRGLWMRNLQVMLPADFKPEDPSVTRGHFNLDGLIIDNQGITFDIFALDPLKSGILGGCAFSVDTIKLNMYKTDDFYGQIRGGITLPIASDPLIYEGILTIKPSADMDYSFYIKPTSNIALPAWIATLNIDESSELRIRKDNHGTAVHFLLNGDITLDSKYNYSSNTGSSNYQFFMPGLKFENFGMANRNLQNQPTFYMSEGNWKQTSDQKTIGPYEVSIDVPKPYFSGGEFGLKIESTFSIDIASHKAFTCITTLDVRGGLNWNPAQNMLPTGVGLKAVYLDEIKVDGNFGPVDIKGGLKFYYNDPDFGDGMRGIVDATFDPLIKVRSVAQFGKTAGKDGYTYWYVDAKTNIPGGIPIAPPLVISGFAGGVYYNMARNNVPQFAFSKDEPHSVSTPNPDDVSASASGVKYIPQKHSIGFKAGVAMALHSAENAFNGSFGLECSFSGSSFTGLEIKGDAYLLSNFPSNSTYLARANVEMFYDRPSNFIKFTTDVQAQFILGMRVNIPIRFESEISAGKWFLMMGDPHGERISCTLVNINEGFLKAKLTAESYMAFGNNLPNTNLPDPPHEIVKFLNLSNLDKHRASITQIPRSGMLFGAKVDGTLDIDLVVYCYLRAIAGFDVSLRHMENAFCNQQPMGLYGWYGLGQVYGYFHGDVGIKIDVWFFKGKVSLCELKAGAFLKGGMPTPFWAYGKARVSGSVLGGLIKISTSVELDMGERCYGPAGDPLANIKVLEEIQPGYKTFEEAVHAEPESIFTIPRVAANLDLSDMLIYPLEIEIPPSDENKYGETRAFSFYIHSITLYEVNKQLPVNPSGGKQLNFKIGNPPNRTQVVVQDDENLKPNTIYAIRVLANAKQRFWTKGSNNMFQSSWEDPVINGVQEPRYDTLDAYFRTGPMPNNFEQNVLASYPLNRQRYFPKDMPMFFILNKEQDYIFNNDSVRIEAWLKRVRVPSWSNINAYSQRLQMRQNGRFVEFTGVNRNLLDPQEVYSLEIIRINLAAEQKYLEEMAKEKRRLVVKNLLDNSITHAIVQTGGITSEQMNNITTQTITGEGIGLAPLNLQIGSSTTQSGGTTSNGGFLAQLQSMGQITHNQPGQITTSTPNYFGLDQPRELLEMLTTEEYNQTFRADTLDFREQKLEQKFNKTHVDTLFRIVFATSMYNTLHDKVNAYGQLIVSDPLMSYAESVNAVEPFEQIDLFGLTEQNARTYGYMGAIPPLLKFDQVGPSDQLPSDNNWFHGFFRRTNEILSFCGPPAGTQNWRPRHNAPVVTNPRKISVHVGSSYVYRDYQNSPTWLHSYPGLNRQMYHGQQPMYSDLPKHLNDFEAGKSLQEIQYGSLVIHQGRKLRYNHSETQKMLSHDVSAVRNFLQKSNDYAEMFKDTTGAGRRELIKDWVEMNVEIEGKSGSTTVKMPAYQLGYFYDLRPSTAWMRATIDVPGVGNYPWSGYVGNYFQRDIRVTMLDMPGSQISGGSGWQYGGQMLGAHGPLNLKLRYDY